MSQFKNVISIKKWGSRLAGKPSAKALRQKCEKGLITGATLVINMAGVKDITPGFAQECFGKLYVIAKEKKSAIEFSHVDNDGMATIIMNGILAEKSPR